MTHDSPTIGTYVTVGHPRDSRASRVPTPTPTPLKTVHPDAVGALRGSPRGAHATTKGCGKPAEIAREAGQEHRPAAGREEHRASRRGRSSHQEIAPGELFRVQCALIKRELAARPELNFGKGYANLVEHMKCAAAQAHLPYGADSPFGRALEAVEAARRPKVQRLVQRQAEPPRTHWRDRCAHTPRCHTPTACALKDARSGR